MSEGGLYLRSIEAFLNKFKGCDADSNPQRILEAMGEKFDHTDYISEFEYQSNFTGIIIFLKIIISYFQVLIYSHKYC